MVVSRVTAAGIACVLAGLVAGCGTGFDARQARVAAERFQLAAIHHDGATACRQLSPPLRKQLIADESEPTCAKAIAQLELHGTRAASVRVYATSAQVALAGGDTLFLGLTREGWRIEALGCKPQGPGPYDCEAEV